MDETQNKLTFIEIYSKHYNTIYRYSYKKIHNKELAEDLSSEVFVKLLEKWSLLEHTSEKALLSWLYKTLNNILLNYYKTKKLHFSESNSEILFDEFEAQGIWAFQDIFDTQEIQDVLYKEYIQQISHLLNNNEFLLFKNIVLNNRSIAETAKIINKKENTVKVSWKRLKKKLKKILIDLIN